MPRKLKLRSKAEWRKRLDLVAKAKSFKRSKQQKYAVTKKYFASEDPTDERKFAKREREFLSDLSRLLLYLSIVLAIYFFLLR